MILYVARHGQSVWNSQNKVCGITDVELTSKGIEQAEQLSELIKNYDIDIILSSPLKRAVDTSNIIGEKCNVKVHIEPLLIEQNYGIYEGVDRSDEHFLANKRNFAFKYPGGESMIQVACRIYALIDKLKEIYSDKNVLILSHGGVCRIIKTYFEDMTNEEFFHYTLPNGKVERYRL